LPTCAPGRAAGSVGPPRRNWHAKRKKPAVGVGAGGRRTLALSTFFRSCAKSGALRGALLGNGRSATWPHLLPCALSCRDTTFVCAVRRASHLAGFSSTPACGNPLFMGCLGAYSKAWSRRSPRFLRRRLYRVLGRTDDCAQITGKWRCADEVRVKNLEHRWRSRQECPRGLPFRPPGPVQIAPGPFTPGRPTFAWQQGGWRYWSMAAPRSEKSPPRPEPGGRVGGANRTTC